MPPFTSPTFETAKSRTSDGEAFAALLAAAKEALPTLDNLVKHSAAPMAARQRADALRAAIAKASAQ